MAIPKVSVTNPQEPDNDISMILENGSFDGGGGAISSVSSLASTTSTTSLEESSTDGSSSKLYYSKKVYTSSPTPQKLHYRNSSSSHHHPHNHQYHHQYPYLPVVTTTTKKRRKPSRVFHYVQNHTMLYYYATGVKRRQRTYYNISAIVVSFLLVSLTVQRLLSLYFTHRRWINAPITYMHRTCPLPTYELLYPPSPIKTIEVVTAAAAAAAQSSSQRQLTDASNLSSNNNNTSLIPEVVTSSSRYESSSSLPPPPKICITSLTDQKSPSFIQRLMRWRNFDGIMNLTRPNKVAYAEKYGYHLYDGSDYYDNSRPPAWSKIRAVQALLELQDDNDDNKSPQCDWVLWMDADTVIMNSNIRIEDFLPADPTKDLIVVSDKGGGYNSGVFLFRNSLWSKQFLDEWWNMNDFVRPPGLSLSGDNAALKALLRTMEERQIFQKHVITPPRCTINSFAHFLTLGESIEIMDHLTEQPWYYDNEHYHKGDFIAHIPGFDNKAECLKLLLREAR